MTWNTFITLYWPFQQWSKAASDSWPEPVRRSKQHLISVWQSIFISTTKMLIQCFFFGSLLWFSYGTDLCVCYSRKYWHTSFPLINLFTLYCKVQTCPTLADCWWWCIYESIPPDVWRTAESGDKFWQLMVVSVDHLWSLWDPVPPTYPLSATSSSFHSFHIQGFGRTHSQWEACRWRRLPAQSSAVYLHHGGGY